MQPKLGWTETPELVARVRMKPIRTASGVAPVTVLTKPFPCPGKCIFCPSDVRMPKSYLAREPGAQRAAQFRFDPYGQTLGRLLTYHRNGHRIDKVEMIILGGTWSFYPEDYRIWFVLRCFDAMNDFTSATAETLAAELPAVVGDLSSSPADGGLSEVDGLGGTPTYNQAVSSYLQSKLVRWSTGGRALRGPSWRRLIGATKRPPPAASAWSWKPALTISMTTKWCVSADSAAPRCRSVSRAWTTSFSTPTSVATTWRRRVGRSLGYGLPASSFTAIGCPTCSRVARLGPRRLPAPGSDPEIRPDELKIYPCSLIETAELMQWYRSGHWHPYDTEELADLLADCLASTPKYCRLTRVIRDIPGDENR